MPAFSEDEPSRLEQISSLEHEGFNNYRLVSTMHIGTHIDGPMHMSSSPHYIGELALDRFIGNGCLYNAFGKRNITCSQDFMDTIIQESIVLVYTGFNTLYGKDEYFTDYPDLQMDAAKFLVDRQVKMICLDAPSPDHYPYEVHKFLLENSILIAENLTNFEQLVDVKDFEIFALPLHIIADSSPARIIAKITRNTHGE